MTDAPRWYRWSGSQLILNIRVVPRSKQDEIAGVHDDRLRVRVAAPPVDGRANTRLVEFLAGEFGVAKGDVTLLAGHTGRRKRVSIAGPKRLPSGIQPAK
ncbi:MAG: YggU family protein [Gammaproteobacteria bacterium]|nr:MAG: YggU family protein [Gammaproteobacteria bacterium]